MVAPGPPPDLDDTHVFATRGRVRLLVRRDWREHLPLEALLDGAPPSAWGRPVPHDLRGRGAVEVLATARGQIVAKVLSRGGLLGGLLRHRYLDPWRCAREAAVAEALAARGCPTPPVVVARATRRGPGLHRLEIATARIPGARDLLEVLRGCRPGADAPGGPGRARLVELAGAAGRTLRRLHDAGLRHRDLQAKNLLVPPDGPGADGLLVVIDLDRCRLGAPLPLAARVVSLSRFARSLVKHGLLPERPEGGTPPGAWSATRAFARGYGVLPGVGRSGWLDRVAAHLRRSVAAHRWFWSRTSGAPS